jgi:chaperonin GroEL (HSP60 family)
MMAQAPDGSGKGPVVITKESTSVTSGQAVTQKLVGAAIAFGNVLRGTFGPNGLDKMLYKTNGETAVTNDGAKIVAELLVKHPAAKAFVSLAESQENACGDGVTGCIILASELMSEAGRLLERGLHPLVVVKGYELALDKTLATIDSRKESISEKLNDVSRTSLVGRSTEGALDHLANLIARAVEAIPDTDYERVRMVKDGQGTISDSRIINGLVLEKRIALDRIPRNLSELDVAVLSCPVGLEKTSRDAEIEISTPNQLEAFIDAEEQSLESKAQKIIESGVGAIFSAEKIDERVTHILADHQIYSLGGLEKSLAEDMAITTNAALCDHLDDIPSSIGKIKKLTHERLEGPEGIRERLIIDAGANSGIVTLLVGGTDGVAAAEIIRGLFDSLRSSCIAKADDSILLGGGSLHISASLAIRKEAETCSGRERLSMEAFARALEAIPAALATNTGEDRIDALLQLRSMHHGGNNSAGINRFGEPSEINGVWLPTYTLEHAISAACETACGLIRVDQVISARGD